MKVSWDDDIPNIYIYRKIKAMFQTTNQYIYIYTYIHTYIFTKHFLKVYPHILKGLNQHHGMTFFAGQLSEFFGKSLVEVISKLETPGFPHTKSMFAGGYPQKKMGKVWFFLFNKKKWVKKPFLSKTTPRPFGVPNKV